uniref:Uncharacterized protein n=1 Tax=Kalanchoe fedtschenkoi TaxID=63787 RepID=A0A7N0V2P9_KALFE
MAAAQASSAPAATPQHTQTRTPRLPPRRGPVTIRAARAIAASVVSVASRTICGRGTSSAVTPSSSAN